MVNVVKAEEYFYGVTLDKKGASITWDSSKAENDEYAMNSDRLHLRQILLGHTAKPGEYNVVEVETISVNDTIKTPIAVLKVGESRVAQPKLEFPCGPVTFTLIEGNGPVYIHAQQVPGAYEDVQIGEGGEEFDSDEETIEEEDLEDDAEEFQPSKKPKLENNASNKKSNSQKKK